MRAAIVASLALALSACGATPIATVDTGNPGATADLIAKVDGCHIWRVRDGNERTIYFARCEHGATGTEWQESCGKRCSRSVQTITNEGTKSNDGK